MADRQRIRNFAPQTYDLCDTHALLILFEEVQKRCEPFHQNKDLTLGVVMVEHDLVVKIAHNASAFRAAELLLHPDLIAQLLKHPVPALQRARLIAAAFQQRPAEGQENILECALKMLPQLIPADQIYLTARTAAQTLLNAPAVHDGLSDFKHIFSSFRLCFCAVTVSAVPHPCPPRAESRRWTGWNG